MCRLVFRYETTNSIIITRLVGGSDNVIQAAGNLGRQTGMQAGRQEFRQAGRQAGRPPGI